MEADEYRRMAAVEDEMWFYRALHAKIERRIATAFAGGPMRLLDAGCGTGGLIRRLASLHPEWRCTGLDLEPLACGLARCRCTAEIVQGSVTALPFASGEFDAVVSADVLYHLDDDAAALREFHRVLRPGGILIVNVPAHRWLWSYHDVTVHGRRRYTRNELRTKLRSAGFRAGEVTHWNTLPLPLVIARRKLLPPPRTGSDVRLYPPLAERFLGAAMRAEEAWLRHVGSLPLGCSILAVARS